MQKLWIDLETYSEVPIRNGTFAYAEDCEIMLAAYAVDDEPAQCWDSTLDDEIPLNLLRALDEAPEVWAHNAMFDRTVLSYNLPVWCPAVERWRDTMVQALEHGLPGALGKVSEALKLADDQAKIKDGKTLVQLFCKPRPANSTLRRATRETHPDEWKRFVEYATQDVEAMRHLHRALPKWNYPNNPTELSHWHLDQRINSRGFCVDTDLVRAAVETVRVEQLRLKQQTAEATKGAVPSSTQRDVMLEHILLEYGIDLPDMQKATLQWRLDDPDLPDGLRELLGIRLQASATSTSKYTALSKAVNDDGRCRGTIQFAGAARTGRAAGRTFQPQNLPSRGLLKAGDTELGIAAMKFGAAPLLYDNLMLLATSAVRGCLIAPPGKKLVISDLANIEGRVAAWLVGEAWKLQAYRDYDSGFGPDLYCLAYANSFGIEPGEVDGVQRSVGKVQELMLQYQGGVGAFVTGAASYRIDLEAMAEDAYDTLPDDERHAAEKFLAWVEQKKMPTFGLSDKAFVTCDVFKRLWRASNPAISGFWDLLQNAVIRAIKQPGETVVCGPLSIQRAKAWLLIKLPSGRYLCYPAPEVDTKGGISYLGTSQYTRQWCRLRTYGGKLFENVCQAVARDVLYGAMPVVEAAGYEIVLHVHDELVTEVPDIKEFTVDNLSAILSAEQSWTEGLPLAAAGFETLRYRKG